MCGTYSYIKVLYMYNQRLTHDEMEVKVNVGGTLSGTNLVVNGLKQDDILAPTLFATFFCNRLSASLQLLC